MPLQMHTVGWNKSSQLSIFTGSLRKETVFNADDVDSEGTFRKEGQMEHVALPC
jgi:hypothetical protein